jgi:hypothetical protein
MRHHFGPESALAALVLIVLPASAPAQSVENAPSFNAAKIPGINRVGENYTIRNPVRSDGILRVYVLATPYGDITVNGDEMMRMRSVEFKALAALEKVSTSTTFTRGLAEKGLSPLKFTGKLVTDPAKTINDTFAGVGGFFGRISSGLNNADQARDDAISNLIGVTDERRKLAAAYGVDPYTDLPPLAEKLNQLSQAAALGGLVVTGALMAVPGAAGIIVSNLSTVDQLNGIGLDELARSYTAEQILDINRDLLNKMGVDQELRDKLLANRYYTPIDMAAMVAAIDGMKAVGNRSAFFARAAAANGRAIAYFMRRQAELLADDYRKHGNYVRFVALANYPFVVTREGKVTALLPIDALSWTSITSRGFEQVTAERRRAAPKAQGELRIAGTATALAKRELKQEGWTVVEHARP